MLLALADLEKKAPGYQKAGIALEQAGRLKEALAAYETARELAASPGDTVAASLSQAEAARKLGQERRAEQAYRAALECDAANRAALRGLADLAYSGNRLAEAEKWSLLLKKSGPNPEDRRFLANLYLKKHDYGAAILELKALLALQGKPRAAETELALAQAYESAGRLKESAAAYRSLLQQVPANPGGQLRYGTLLIRMQRFPEAGVALNKALQSEPGAGQRSLAHKNLALVYEKSGNFDQAARELELSLRDQPPPAGELLVRLARLWSRGGRPEQALGYLDRALLQPGLAAGLQAEAHREKSAIFEKKGETSAALCELEKAVPPGAPAEPQDQVRLAVLLSRGGRSAEALGHLELALAKPQLSGDLRLAALREKGFLLEQSGRRAEAVQAYEKAIALGDSSPGIYLSAANLYQAEAHPEMAVSYLDQVLKNPGANAGDICGAEDGLGMDYLKLGRTGEAASHFATALQRCGENWQRHYYLGLAHYRAREPEAALEQFTRADALKRDPASLLGMALCHKDLGRPGAALHYLQLAMLEPGQATAGQLKQINDTLGYLYAEEYDYDKASEAFSRSLAGSPDTIVSLKLAEVYNLDEKTDKSWQALQQVDPGKFSLAETVEYNDLKSGLLQKSGKKDDALALMERTQRLQPGASRSYAMGLLSQDVGRRQQALQHFQAAYQADPQQDDYACALGYAYASDGRLVDAIKVFEQVANRDPDSEKVREELGYLYSRLGKNDQAAQLFKQALDIMPALPPGSPEESDRMEEDAHRLRGEIAKLTRTFSGAMYASYRTGKAPSTFLANGEQISGALSGQLGVEASYRPPVVGLIDDRILEIFGRVFGSLNPDSAHYNEESTQAGIGLRYKFLREENLWISAERLIKVGKFALDDWLLRLLYSRGKGLEPLAREHNQDYYLLYGELDGYLSSGSFAVYGEGRKGRAFALRPDLLLAPYLALDGRWQTPFTSGGNYLEGGAGISLKYFFNGTAYENYRDTVDFSLSYKHGLFFNQQLSRNSGAYDSLLLSIGLFF